MDASDHQYRHDGDASTSAETSSCASSLILVEPTASTPNLPSDSEKHCPSLIQLPKHLLSTIAAHLDVVSKMCLQSVNHRLRNVIDVDRANLSICARVALACRLGFRPNSPLLSTCVLCKNPKCVMLFKDVLTHLEDPRQGTAELVTRLLDRTPWARRYITQDMEEKQKPNYHACAMRRFTPDPVVEALMPFVTPPTLFPTWIRFLVLRCTHCGRCISEGDTRLEGCRDCKCDYCPRLPDRHFRRCGPGMSDWLRPKLVKENLINDGNDVVEGFWKLRITSPVIIPNGRADGKPLEHKGMYYVNEARTVRPELLQRGGFRQIRLGRGDP